MKLLGSLFKALLTMVGIYLVAYLIGRAIAFMLRLVLWPISKYPLSHVFGSPGFFVCGDLGLYSALSLGTIGAGLSGRFQGEQIFWAWIFGVIFTLAFVGSMLQAVRYEDQTNEPSGDLESLRKKFREIDEEYASKPDYKPPIRLPRHVRRSNSYDVFGPEFLN